MCYYTARFSTTRDQSTGRDVLTIIHGYSPTPSGWRFAEWAWLPLN